MQSELPISETSVKAVSETAYHGAIEFKYSSEQINYIYRSETPYNILSSIPTYFETVNLTYETHRKTPVYFSVYRVEEGDGWMQSLSMKVIVQQDY